MLSISDPKIMIMAGGTGGHVFPALAVAQELIARNCEVQWMGTDRGIEAKVVPENNITLNILNITGIRGKGVVALLKAPWKIFLAINEAKTILRKFRPNVVLGMGGYVSGPGGIAAWLLGIPLVVHEQNAYAGTTNKWLAKFAKKVLTAFPNVLVNAICIGNPIRKSIIDIAAPSERLSGRIGPLRLLVLGGSLGAKAINQLVPQAVSGLADGSVVEIRHQTGTSHFEQTKALYSKCKVKADITPFIDDMAEALAWADLVVCRAGALTVSELSAAGVASILIPFPFAIDDHQTANANWLVKQGAAYIHPQGSLTSGALRERIFEFVQEPAKLVVMAEAARRVAKPNAAVECADICLEFANG